MSRHVRGSWRPTSPCLGLVRSQVFGCVAAVSRAGATAEIGGSSCRHDAEKLRLRVPLAVPATAVIVWCACACITDAS
jgi:hypothetical protein